MKYILIPIDSCRGACCYCADVPQQRRHQTAGCPRSVRSSPSSMPVNPRLLWVCTRASVGESVKLEHTYSSGERSQTTRCTAHSYRRICIPDCHGRACFFLDGSSNSDNEYEKQCNATSNQPLRFPDIGDRLSSLGLRGLRSLDDVRTIWMGKHKPRRDFFPFEITCCCTIWASIQRLVLQWRWEWNRNGNVCVSYCPVHCHVSIKHMYTVVPLLREQFFK